MTLSIVLRRLVYRVAYHVLRAYWRVFNPRVEGVKCVVLDGDSVLLVRHTYGERCWDLPGGMIRRGEPPLLTAQREMGEELGLADVEWRPIGDLQVRMFKRDESLYCFRTDVHSPALTLDLVELQGARWFAPGRLPADLGVHVRAILALAGEPHGS
jgi:8-oxo-dGTP pyrophosphatase MutT (NUDIX family)